MAALADEHAPIPDELGRRLRRRTVCFPRTANQIADERCAHIMRENGAGELEIANSLGLHLRRNGVIKARVGQDGLRLAQIMRSNGAPMKEIAGVLGVSVSYIEKLIYKQLAIHAAA